MTMTEATACDLFIRPHMSTVGAAFAPSDLLYFPPRSYEARYGVVLKVEQETSKSQCRCTIAADPKDRAFLSYVYVYLFDTHDISKLTYCINTKCGNGWFYPKVIGNL
jgi:hypothetical protein